MLAPEARAGLGWWIVCLLALGIALHAFAYLRGPDGAIPPFLLPSFAHRRGLFLLHILAGGAALALGPLQFRRGLLIRYRALHRSIGHAYLLAVLISGSSALVLSRYSAAGPITHLGFGGLATAWLATSAAAYLSIQRRQVLAHRRWMIRSFALTFAAVTLRLWLPLLLVSTGGDFSTSYKAAAWLCWVPNLLAAEWWIRRTAAGADVPGLLGASQLA
jgi:hypothetical protein